MITAKGHIQVFQMFQVSQVRAGQGVGFAGKDKCEKRFSQD